MSRALPGRKWTAPLVLLSVLAFAAAPALAHALLTTATPKPGSELHATPKRLTLHFSEPLDVKASGLKVFDQAAHRMPVDVHVRSRPPEIVATFPKSLPKGSYTVVWTTVSALDGHLVRGSYQLGIDVPAGDPSRRGSAAGGGQAASTAGQVAGRWLEWLGMFLWAGAVFWRLIDRWGSVGTGGEEAAAGELERRIERRLVRLARWGAGLFGAGIAVVVGVQGASLGFGRGVLSSLLSGTPHGVLTTVRLVLSAVGVAAASWTPLSALAALGGIVAAGFASHAAAVTSFRTASMVADQLHLLSAVVWGGGIVVLGVAFIGPERRRPTELLPWVERYSPWALWGALVVVGTGFINADFELADRWSLLATPYGRTLALKIALVALLVLLSALHVFVLRPRLRRARAAGGAPSAVGRGWWRAMALQSLVVVLVVGVTALLISSAPPRDSVDASGGPPPLVLADAAGPYQVRVRVTPARLGTDTFRVTLLTPLERPVADARVTLAVVPAAGGRGAAPVTLAHQYGGVYEANGGFPRSGRWDLDLTVQRPGGQAWRTHIGMTLPVPEARAILERATANFLALHSVHAVQVISDGHGLVETDAVFEAPDLVHYTVSTGDEVIGGPGGRRYERTKPDTPWKVSGWPKAARWPQVDWSLPHVVDVHLVDQQSVDGHPCWVLAFEDTRIGGIYFRIWVDQQTLLMRRERMITTAHYMTETYSRFNAPVSITAPKLHGG